MCACFSLCLPQKLKRQTASGYFNFWVSIFGCMWLYHLTLLLPFFNLPLPLPPLLQTCQLGICFGWIPGTSALSTRTQPLSCGMTWKLSCLEHGKVSSKNINCIANEIHFIIVPERGGTWAIFMHNGLIFGQSFTQVYIFIP